MDLMEYSEEREMTREEAAMLLHEIADSLGRHNDVTFTRNGINFRINVPKQVTVEVEVEIESDESSIEIEIKW